MSICALSARASRAMVWGEHEKSAAGRDFIVFRAPGSQSAWRRGFPLEACWMGRHCHHPVRRGLLWPRSWETSRKHGCMRMYGFGRIGDRVSAAFAWMRELARQGRQEQIR